ncbi:hypothetical protein V7S43_011639 [Phytophthora oleae]|uniref:Uncharacterized protein n=1 Tax=Phytophthora oleae TaxID=2107226 RepID=A0ABD3FB99_9STRA
MGPQELIVKAMDAGAGDPRRQLQKEAVERRVWSLTVEQQRRRQYAEGVMSRHGRYVAEQVKSEPCQQ